MTDEPVVRLLSGVFWRQRLKQLLYGGGDIRLIMLADGVARLGQMNEEYLLFLVKSHELQKNNGNFLKSDVKRSVSRVILPDGRKVIVKEYHPIRKWLCFSPDQRGWLGSWRLQGAAQCLGWYRKFSLKSGFLFFDDAGDRDLSYKNQVVIPENIQNEFYQAGVLCGTLHHLHVFHSDLKPSNFVVGEQGKVTLIDCDDVRVKWHFPRALMLRNIAQLLGGIYYLAPNRMNLIAGKAFFQGYMQKMPGNRFAVEDDLETINQIAMRLYPTQKAVIEPFFKELKNARSAQSR